MGVSFAPIGSCDREKADLKNGFPIAISVGLSAFLSCLRHDRSAPAKKISDGDLFQNCGGRDTGGVVPLRLPCFSECGPCSY